MMMNSENAMNLRTTIRRLRLAIAAAALAAAIAGAGAAGAQPVYDLKAGARTTLAAIAPELAARRIVVVGEHHATESHHRAQLEVIRRLVEAGARVAVGLEMFRRESQTVLDRWVSGASAPAEFERAFRDNWGYPFAAYRPIFDYAREKRLPMIGLNVPREVTRQVARGGFESLTEAQRGLLADVTCAVDEEYMRYIRRAYQAHGHGGSADFVRFCEAQMVWDAAMAVYALDYLKGDAEAVVVILTGVGHAQKGAVPRQVRLRSEAPVAVLLPEVPGSIDARTADLLDADYLLLDLK
jgi:uncharacterized iron-regulated protein